MGLLHFTVALALAASAHSFKVPSHDDTTTTETLTRFVFTCPCDTTTSVSVGTTYPTSPAEPSGGHGWNDWDGAVSQSSRALTDTSSSHSYPHTWSKSSTSITTLRDTATATTSGLASTSPSWTSTSAHRFERTTSISWSESTTSTSSTTSQSTSTHTSITSSSAAPTTSASQSTSLSTTSSPAATTTSKSSSTSSSTTSSLTATATSESTSTRTSTTSSPATTTTASSGGPIQPGTPFLCTANFGGRLRRRDTKYLTIGDGAGVLASGCNRAVQLSLSPEGALRRYSDGLVLGAPRAFGLQLFEFINGISGASLTDGWSISDDGSLYHPDVSLCMRGGGVIYAAFAGTLCDGTAFSLIATTDGCPVSSASTTISTSTPTSSSPIVEPSTTDTTTLSSSGMTTTTQATSSISSLGGTTTLAATSTLTTTTTSTVPDTTTSSECSVETITTTLKKRGVLEVRTITVPAAGCSLPSSTTSECSVETITTTLKKRGVLEVRTITVPAAGCSLPSSTTTTADHETVPSTTSVDEAQSSPTTSVSDASQTSATSTTTTTATTLDTSSTTSSADPSSPTFGQPFSIQLNSADPNKHKRDISVVGYVNGALTRVTSEADAVSFVLTSDGVLMIFGTGLVVGFSGNPGTSPLMIYSSVSAMPTTIIWSFSGGALVLPGAGFCVGANNVMSVSVGGATDSGCAPVTPVPNTDPATYNTDVASSITPSPQTTTSTTLGSTSATVDATSSTSSSLSTTTASITPDLSSTTVDATSIIESSSLTTTTVTTSSTSLTTIVYVSTSSTTSFDSTTSEGTATTSTTTATRTEETSGPNCSILPLEDQTAPEGTQYTQFFYSCHAAIPATLGTTNSIATAGDDGYDRDPTAFLRQCVANAEQVGASVWTYSQSSVDFKFRCGFWNGLVADEGIFVDDSTVFTMNAMRVVGDGDGPSTTTTSSSSTTATSTTTTIGVMATVPASAPVCTPDSSYFDHVHCPDVYIYDSVQECQCFNRVQGGQNMCAYTFYYDRPCMWDSECAAYGEWSYCLTASFTGTGPQGYCSDNDSSKTCLTGGYQANTTTPSAIFSTPSVTSSTMTTTSSSATATGTCAGLCSTKSVSSGSHVWSQVEAGCVEYNFDWVYTRATFFPAGLADCEVIQYCANFVVQQGMTAFRTFWVPTENQWHCDAGLENDETGDYEYSLPQGNFYMYNLVTASTPSTTAATTTTSSVTSTTSPANCVATSASVGDILTTTNGNSWVNFFSSGCGLSLDWQSLNFNNLYVYLRTEYTYEEALLDCASVADRDGSPVFEFETDTRNNNRWVCWTLNDITNDPAQFQPYGGIADAYGWYLPSRMPSPTPTPITTPPSPAPTCINGAIVTDTNGDTWETLCGQGSYYGWTFFSSYSDVATLADCIVKCNEDDSCNAVSIEYRDAPTNNLCGFIYMSTEFQPYDFEADTAIKISGANARSPINVPGSSTSETTSVITFSTTTASTTSTTTPPPSCAPSAIGDVTALYDRTQTFRNFYTGCGKSMEGGTDGGLGIFPSKFATMWRASANWEDYTFDNAVSRCVQFAIDNGANAVEFYVDANQNWICVGVDDVTVDVSSFYPDSNVANVWGFVWENSCQNAPLNDITATDGTIFAEFYTGCSASLQGNTPGGLVNLNRVVSANWQAPGYSGYTFDEAVQNCADTTISQGGNLFEFYIGTDDWWYCIAVNDLPATTASFYPDATIGKVWGFAITGSQDVCEPSQLAGSVQLANGTTYEEFYDACHVSLQGDTAGGVGWMTTVFGFNNPPYEDGNYGGWTLQTALELCIRDAAAAGATVIQYYENTDELPTWYCFGVNNVPALEDSFYGDGSVGRLWAFKLDESTLPTLQPF